MDNLSKQDVEFIKNPFGRKNGRLITLFDLDPDKERGEKCNCVCPLCGGPFEARMGEVRSWHFAHTGEGCDETKSYINANYELLRDSVIREGKINLPHLICRFITRGDVPELNRCTAEVCDVKSDDTYTILEESEIIVESAELDTDSTGTHRALFVNGKLAIVIELDKKYCVAHNASRYKDYDTLIIDFRKIDYSKGINSLYSYIASNTEVKKWMTSSSVDKWVKDQFEILLQQYTEKLQIVPRRGVKYVGIDDQKGKSKRADADNKMANSRMEHFALLLKSSKSISGTFFSHQSDGREKAYNEVIPIKKVSIDSNMMNFSINDSYLSIFAQDENIRSKRRLSSGRLYVNIDFSEMSCENMVALLRENGITLE